MANTKTQEVLKSLFGLNKNCTIITKDNKILQYSALTKTISVIGDYNPDEFLDIAKIK